jgi:putative tricarboxylic transport membrane protein
MRRSDIAAGLILLGFAGIILLQSLGLPFGSIRTPHTGFFPLVLAVLLLLLSLLLLAQALRQSENGTHLWQVNAEGWKRIGFILGAMIGFALVLEGLGYLLSTFILMVFLLRVFEPQRWIVVITVAFSTALISYVIFASLLGIPLPAGILGI